MTQEIVTEEPSFLYAIVRYRYYYDADSNVSEKVLADGSYVVYHYSDGVLEYEEHFNSAGTLQELLKYSYDADGNILSVDKCNNGPIDDINPMRYNDYYYDLQTVWYQLTSRFYDPAVDRFLNADDLSLLTETDSSVVDKNLYAYCDGNPVMREDSDGESGSLSPERLVH